MYVVYEKKQKVQDTTRTGNQNNQNFLVMDMDGGINGGDCMVEEVDEPSSSPNDVADLDSSPVVDKLNDQNKF